MLAKIAHSYATCCLGLEKFEPLLIDAILGKRADTAYLIGDNVEPAVGLDMHTLSLMSVTQLGQARGLTRFLKLYVVNVRLFANMSHISYDVVAGYAKDS